MSIIHTLERKYGRFVPENLTKFLLIGQVASYILVYTHPEYGSYFFLTGRHLFQGQFWRLFTIIVAPVSENLVFVVLAWYFLYLLGNALENKWGSFRYLIYIAIAYIGTIICALLFPNFPVSNVYMYTSLFLAFAHLYPSFQVLLFFILPVKVKWLGYLTWVSLIASFLFGDLPIKVLILLSESNFFFFFYDDLMIHFRSLYKGTLLRPKNVLHKRKPLHICAVCGSNEIDNPNMEIRYCSQCSPTTCYCGEHIKHHQHKRMVN